MHVYDSISVGSFVFIGVNSIVMPGVSIGDRSVIGAGSIVTKDVPAGEVWAGIPARRLKSVSDYRDGVLVKGINWPVGRYDEEWKNYLISRHFGEN